VISPRTGEHHRSAVLGQLGGDTRHHVARRAAELGVSEPVA
jgi:hypothetical protein